VKTAATARHEVEVEDGRLRLAVVADTHSRPHPASRELIASERPDRILHAGDIGDLTVLDALGEVAPVLAVRGNIDTPLPEIPDRLTLDVVERGRRLLRLFVVHIAVNGPRLLRDVAHLARSEKADLVVCGHSHVPFIGKDKGLAVFNPGSIGPRRFKLPIVFGMLALDAGRFNLRHVDCESGKTWTPRA
jgi:putative phosphoesterase